jgi:hypothetical protein
MKKGIGGWLIVLAVQMIIGLCIDLFIVFALVQDGLGKFDYKDVMVNQSLEIANELLYQWSHLTTIFIIASFIQVFLVVLFFKKHKEFPRAYVYLNITSVLIILMLEFSLILNDKKEYFPYTLICLTWLIIWGIYLFRSKRVKETFIEQFKTKKYVKISVDEYELIKKNLYK